MQDQSMYKYDAFISYRHTPECCAIAHRLQKLLEGYKSPAKAKCQHTRRIGRIFVDDTEMPNIPDLTQGIEEALSTSRYLIVLCCEELLDSKWCHSELLRFKELNNGSAAHIIPVLVGGDPGFREGESSKVFFPEMLFTEDAVMAENGSLHRALRAVEPLYTDVRGKDLIACLKKLGGSRLRIAAPLLGCSYDELYRRHRRRSRQRIASSIAALGTAAALVTLSLMSLDAGRRDAAAMSKYLLAIDSIQEGNSAGLGMRHLTDSLLLGPPNTTPQASSLALLMQSQTWPLRAQLKQGKIMGGIMLLQDGQTAAGEGTQYERNVQSDLMDKEIASYDALHQLLLIKENEGYAVYDCKGRLYDTIMPEGAAYLGTESGNGGWVFAGSKKDGVFPFYIYAAGAKTLTPLMLPEPVTANDLWAELGLEDLTGFMDESSVYVTAYRQGQAAVAVYPDRLEFYALEGGIPQRTNTIPIEELFQDKYSLAGSTRKISKTFMDLQGRVMAVSDGVATTIVSLGKTSVMQRIFQDQHLVNDVAFSDDLGRFAIAYGEDPNVDISMRGGYFEVWKMTGNEPIFTTEGMYPEGIQSVRWGKGSALAVTISFDHIVRLWKAAGDMDAGYTEACVPVTVQSRYLDAMIDKEGILTVETDGNKLQSFAFMAPGETMVADLDNELYPILYVEKTAENGLALLTDNSLNTVSLADGSVVSAEKASSAAYASFVERRANQLQTAPYLMKGVSPLPFDGWPYQELLSKVYKEVVLPGAQTPHAGSFLKQALLSPDASTAYVIGSVVPYIAAYSIDWSQKTTALKQAAYLPGFRAPLTICQNTAGKYLAVTLSNNDIWLYEATSIQEPLYKVRTETKGSVEAAALNEAGNFLAVMVKPSAEEYMTQERNLEIWYMPTGTCVLNRSVKNGSSLCFIDDYLYYSVGSRLYRLWLPTQSPSAQRIAFFNALCGYRFDAYAVPYPAAVDLKDVAVPLGDEWDQLYQIQEKSEEPTP